MKKYVHDLPVVAVETPRKDYVLLKLCLPSGALPEMLPGQFVEVQVAHSPQTFLRRPISINYVDEDRNELWLLVHVVGEGTRALSQLQPGDTLNCVYPLGNGFSTDYPAGAKVLLVGGGVGTAPLLQLGKCLRRKGCNPTFLLGGRSAQDLMQLEQFEQFGTVCVTTEDGTLGHK